MVYVGIDVAKDKHDCYIVNSDGEVLAEVFTIARNRAIHRFIAFILLLLVL